MMTRDGGKVVFWESLTGVRYGQGDPRVNYMYRRVGSVYSDKRLYANLQENDQCTKTDFGFESKKLWKSMGNLEEFGFTTIQNVGALRMSVHANLALDEEESIETVLRDLVRTYRDAEGLVTMFDDDLSYALSMALSKYIFWLNSG